MSSKKALGIATSKDLDLVQVSAGSVEANIPPTCKIMDYGKYCYNQDKKNKDNRKKQKTTVLKEVGFSVNIGEGDFETKIRHIKNFLEQGNKVKVTIKLYGRERNDPSRGFEVMQRIVIACGPLAKVESKAKAEGRNIYMTLSASNVLQDKAKQADKVEESRDSQIAENASSGDESTATENALSGSENAVPENFERASSGDESTATENASSGSENAVPENFESALSGDESALIENLENTSPEKAEVPVESEQEI